jgi:hypothetical protein
MSISRREFMRAATLVALAAGIPLSTTITGQAQQVGAQRPAAAGGSLPPEIYNDPLFYHSKATFTSALKTKFVVQTRGFRGIVLTLAEVKDIGPVPDQAGKECFSLLFRSANALRQNTYTLKHDVLGTFDVFIVPLPKDRLSRRHIAVINRLNP